MAKIKNAELIRRAIRYAIYYEESFVDALGNCNSESDNEARESAEEFIRAAKAYEAKHFPPRKDPLADCVSVDIKDLIKS